MNKLLLALGLALALPFSALSAPVINEFVAENQHGLTDVDGTHSDWIEIHNPDLVPIDLAGWHLTDDPADLDRWTFPTVTIPAGGFLVVFASGKDRAIVGQELHTNFSLKAAGEYLALVRPGGMAIASHFNPQFPPQQDGYSFGVSQDAQTIDFVNGITPTYLVPTAAAALPADWNQSNLSNTTSWQAGIGTGAVGYETAGPPIATTNIANQGVPTQSTTLAGYPATNGTNANYGDFTHTVNSDSAPYWLLTFPTDKQFTGLKLYNRGGFYSRLRDITVKILDGSGTAVYTSALLNPENAGYTYPNGPATLELNFVALTGSPVSGRVIRIERTPDPDLSGSGGQGNADDGTVLSLAEVEAFAVTGTGPTGTRNLSLEPGNAATQTTSAGYPAQNAINNNFADFTHTTGTDTAPVWRLDFGQRRLLSKITLHNRTSCCGSRLRDIIVRVKDQDNTTVTYTSPLLNPENTGYLYPNGPATLEVDFAQLMGGYVVGRYVEVSRVVDPDLSGTTGQGNADESNVLSLGEVVTIGTDYGYYTPLISTDVKTAMHTVNSSAFVRYTFPGADASTVSTLKLRMRYDDGFIAYLNGVKIAERNAPASPLWNSVATGGDREDGAAVNFEEIDVTAFKNALQLGDNVLAIQGLTSAPEDPDFLLQPQLIADRVVIQPFASHLRSPTPGALNDSTWFLDFVADTSFSLNRGFYSTAQTCAITTPTAGAAIYYTTNGSEPTPANGSLYTAPVPITQTTVLRARAFKSDWEPTNVDTQTYIFLGDVIAQQANGAPPAGWPASPVFNAAGQQQALNYGMDPNVRALYTDAGMIEALQQIPTISIVSEQSNLTHPLTGIYTNAYGHGEDWERPASIEWLDPAKPVGFQGEFQHNCGIRIRGGFSRDPSFVKHSFRLYFRDSYSIGKLDYPIFGDAGTSEHDVIDLASSQNYSWARDTSNQDTMVRDQFARQTLLATGSPGCRNRYVHLYLNGIYWGLYYFDERAVAGYGEAYFGGKKEDYDVIKTSNHVGGFTTEATDGYLAALPDGGVAPWRDLWNKHRAFATAPGVTQVGNPNSASYFEMLGCNPDGTRNASMPVLVDVESLINYMLVIFYSGDGDAPLSSFLGNDRANNWFAMKNRSNPNMGFVFFNHDAEHTFGAGSSQANRTGPFNGANQTNFLYSNPQWIFQDLAFSPEFRMRVADLAHKHFTNGGVMTAAVAQARMDAMAAQINLAVKGHSQRWGDTKRTPAFNATDWQNAVNAARNWLNGRETTVLNQLKAYRLTTSYPAASAPLYPNVAAPTLSHPGGTVPAGQQLTITTTSGSIYFTLDGSDPRAVGGSIHGSTYSGAITITEPITTLKARALNGTEWSPLTEAIYFTDVVSPTSANIVISKIHYHPSDPTTAEVSAGHIDADEFEFLELMNISSSSVNLTGCFFADGIEYTAGPKVLSPGARLVLARNPSAYQMRYGSAPAGTFAQKLGNSGDHLVLKSQGGAVIRDFSYGVTAPWPAEPDGFGPALVLRNPLSNPDHSVAANWRASNSLTPGGTDATNYSAWKATHGVVSDIDDEDRDGLGAFLEYATGGAVNDNSQAFLPTISRSGGSAMLTIRRNLTADDVNHTIESAFQLGAWTPVTAVPSARVTNNGFETLTYTFPLVAGPERFFRVRFQAP